MRRPPEIRPTPVLFAAAIGALLLASSATPPAVAQSRPDAATVAAWVQAFYDQTQTVDARFVQRYVSAVYQRTDVSRGQVRFSKPGRMRFDYDQPNGKVIASNGERLVVYEPGEEGRTGQFYEQPMTDSQLPQALSFLTGTGRIDRDFTFRLLDRDAQAFPNGQVLELRSRRPTPHFRRILLYVDENPARRGLVHRVLIVDDSNNRNRFDFMQQRLNTTMPERLFAFQPPRGARRINP